MLVTATSVTFPVQNHAALLLAGCFETELRRIQSHRYHHFTTGMSELESNQLEVKSTKYLQAMPATEVNT